MVGDPRKRDRYREGVRTLRPDIVDSILVALSVQPAITHADLARQVGVSRATIGYYLRGLGSDLRRAATAREEIGARLAVTQLDVVDRVVRASDELRGDIGRARAAGDTIGVFRGFSTLERYLRLLGELLGEVAPASTVTNVYLTKVSALLDAPIDAESVPTLVRTALENAGAPAR